MNTAASSPANALTYHLDRAWRIFATGYSFASFGLGGLIIGLLVWPLVTLISPNTATRRSRMQAVVHLTFRYFIWQMCQLRLMTLTVENRDALLQPGQLIVANHPTLIDVVVLISLIPRTRCVVKDTLLRNPFTRGPIMSAGYIANSASAELIRESAAILRGGESLVIFPEGTRTTPGVQSRFQRGTANIALESGLPIRPVLIDCNPSTLTKGLPWYSVPERRFDVRLRVADPIPTASFLDAAPNRALAARRLNTHLENLLWQGAQELAHESRATTAAL